MVSTVINVFVATYVVGIDFRNNLFDVPSIVHAVFAKSSLKFLCCITPVRLAEEILLGLRLNFLATLVLRYLHDVHQWD